MAAPVKVSIHFAVNCVPGSPDFDPLVNCARTISRAQSAFRKHCVAEQIVRGYPGSEMYGDQEHKSDYRQCHWQRYECSKASFRLPDAVNETSQERLSCACLRSLNGIGVWET